ncbi:MAG: HNH endonuclease [Clostridiales bacterium]|nr:HNH endonuclease [Clostridiales bacterium]
MKIGINKNIDCKTIKYYESFYDIIRTPDFDEKSRLLISKHGIQTIGHSKNRKCRFCGKCEDEVSFKKIAHVFPESIGNNALASNYECDICNQYFGSTIENEYANFFSLYHSIMQINGKNGIPKCSFKVPCSNRTNKCAKHCIEIAFKDNMPFIRQCKEVNSQYIKCSNNSITISKPVGNCCPIAVFKAIVKMAITVMPVEELSPFSSVIKWILEPEHSNFYSKKKLLVRYKMIPGFNVTKYPHYILFRRKKTVWNKPYMLFNLTYGCFSLFVEIPRGYDNCTNSEFEKMPFPPIPFFTSADGIWDLSENKLDKEVRHSIELSFNSMNDCTENIQTNNENTNR